MNGLRIGFIIAYLALLCLYFFSETTDNFKRRAVNKILLASLFEFCALFLCFSAEGPYGIRLLLLAGLTFAFIGDIVLLWSFSGGGMFFGCANLLLFSYEVALAVRYSIPFVRLLPAAAVFIAFWGTLMQFFRKGIIRFGGIGVYPVYMGSVSLHGSLGIVLASVHPENGLLLLGIGSFLMMVADYFLTAYEFRHKKDWVLRCNSAAYFIGTMLSALSLSYSL